MPLVKTIRSPADLADDIERRDRGRPLNLLTQETRAYSLIVAGRDDEASAVRRILVDTYRDADDLLDFEKESLERVRATVERLKADRGAVLDVMREWRREKAARVGVGELLAPLTT